MSESLVDSDKACIWRESEPGHWYSQCGANLTFERNGPLINGARFCLGCGRHLVEEISDHPTLLCLQASRDAADSLNGVKAFVNPEETDASQGSET